MISKTIGCRGLAYFQTNPYRQKSPIEIAEHKSSPGVATPCGIQNLVPVRMAAQEGAGS